MKEIGRGSSLSAWSGKASSVPHGSLQLNDAEGSLIAQTTFTTTSWWALWKQWLTTRDGKAWMGLVNALGWMSIGAGIGLRLLGAVAARAAAKAGTLSVGRAFVAGQSGLAATGLSKAAQVTAGAMGWASTWMSTGLTVIDMTGNAIAGKTVKLWDVLSVLGVTIDSIAGGRPTTVNSPAAPIHAPTPMHVRRSDPLTSCVDGATAFFS